MSAQPHRRISRMGCRQSSYDNRGPRSSRAINQMTAAAFVALVLAQSTDVNGAFWYSSLGASVQSDLRASGSLRFGGKIPFDWGAIFASKGVLYTSHFHEISGL